MADSEKLTIDLAPGHNVSVDDIVYFERHPDEAPTDLHPRKCVIKRLDDGEVIGETALPEEST